MIRTERGYKIPERTDPLETSVEMLAETFLRLEAEQNAQDEALRRARRRRLIVSALGKNPWEVTHA